MSTSSVAWRGSCCETDLGQTNIKSVSFWLNQFTFLIIKLLALTQVRELTVTENAQVCWGKTNPSPRLHGGCPLPAAGPGLCFVFTAGTSLPFALRVCGLEDAGGRHEVLDVLTQDLVLGLQLQVLLLDCVDPRGQVWDKKIHTIQTVFPPKLFDLVIKVFLNLKFFYNFTFWNSREITAQEIVSYIFYSHHYL